MRPRPALLFLFFFAPALVLSGCKRADSRSEQLVIFAASSLRDAFTAIGRDFQAAHPGVKVQLDFAGTQALHTQLEHGASADVFASADRAHMQELVGAGLVQAPVSFARNEPVLVVAREKSASVRTFADLPRAERIILGVPQVPIGRYTLQILDRACVTLGADFRARVEAKVISRELNVRQVLSKVSLGEADAGIVYRSDTGAAGSQVTVLRIPPSINVSAEYPIAIVSATTHASLARAWLRWVLSDVGRNRLSASGFSLPTPAIIP